MGEIEVSGQLNRCTTFCVIFTDIPWAQPIYIKMTMSGKILIADDDLSMQIALYEAIQKKGYIVDRVSSAEEALNRIKLIPFDLIILDIKRPEVSGIKAIPRIKELDSEVVIIVIIASGSKDLILDAIRHGAYDFFTRPFSLEEMEIVIKRAIEKRRLQKELQTLRRKLVSREASKKIIGQSEAMQTVKALIERIAPLESTVLITGGSGTGKELIADVIHSHSKRANGPFIKINCAAIPEGLLESEIFGFEKGAFTGAYTERPGKFELAHKGTILLDEVGDMPLTIQAKLLRVVEHKEVERLGGVKPRMVDTRIIASTNQSLPSLISANKFREELFYRLNVAPIHLPPLRERKEDLPLLVQHFLQEINSKLGTNLYGVSRVAMQLLFSYPWPGNVRELANVLERAAIHCTGAIITEAEIWISPKSLPSESLSNMKDKVVSLSETLQEVERNLIISFLRKSGGIQTEAAKLLGLSPKNLWKKIQKHSIVANDFEGIAG